MTSISRLAALVFLCVLPSTGQVVEANRCVYREGDQTAWAKPEFNDRDWSSSLPDPEKALPTSPWLWARCRFSVGSLQGSVDPLFVQLNSGSAWILYDDGAQIGSFGNPDSGQYTMDLIQDRQLPASAARGNGDMVLAVRLTRRNALSSFGITLGNLPALQAQRLKLMKSAASDFSAHIILAVSALTAGLIFLLLSGAGSENRDIFWLGMYCLGQGLWEGGVAMRLSYAALPQAWDLYPNLIGNLLLSTMPWFFFALAGRTPPRPYWVFAAMSNIYVALATASMVMNPDGAVFYSSLIHYLPVAITYHAGSILLQASAIAPFLPPSKLGRREPMLLVVSMAWMLAQLLDEFFQSGWPSIRPILSAVTIAAVLYFVIHLASRFRRVAAERAELRADMRAARQMQRHLIPEHVPEFPGFLMEASYIPASEVGGDFYYFLPGDEGSLLVVAGDVSGKGLDAAMLVALVIGALSGQTLRKPGAVLANLNQAVMGKTKGGFVTCCCVLLDPDDHLLVANAGHIPPYVGGRPLDVESGLPLGISADAEYPETTSALSGESITLVSDGVVEAADADGELFGFERTREISTRRAGEIAEAAKAWGQNDDITVVTVRRQSRRD